MTAPRSRPKWWSCRPEPSRHAGGSRPPPGALREELEALLYIVGGVNNSATSGRHEDVLASPHSTACAAEPVPDAVERFIP